MRALLALLLLGAPLAAQSEFLTADEVDQVRDTQETDQRLLLYTRFARQRIDLLDQLFAKQTTGRSGLIHDTLAQYTQIIDAIDTWIDDSIRRQKPPASLESLAKAEKEMSAALEKFNAQQAPDKARYEFVLEDAIQATHDSAEMSEQDLRTRTHDVEAKEAEIKKERDAMTAPEQKTELKKQQTKIEAEKQGTPAGKKKPSLYKPGEKPTDEKNPPNKQKDPQKQ